jgi:hypothetical protein
MSERLLKQIELGTSIWVNEDSVETEYILLSKDSYSCELLRKQVLVAKRMHDTDVSVYTDCEMDQYLCSTEAGGFLAKFDAATQSALVSKSISTYSYGDTECSYISRKAYLLSYGQCFGGTPTALEPELTVLPALMLNGGTGDSNGARIAKNSSNRAVNWWLRSPISATQFRFVSDIGTANYYIASGGGWCRPVLSVAAATGVSPEGANKVVLLPETGSRAVEFKGLAGTSGKWPRKCAVKYTAVGLSNVSVKVCNNFGDPEPVWEDATSGADVEFSNITKQTENWQIGIHCYGDTESYNTGYFKEPTILMEV